MKIRLPVDRAGILQCEKGLQAHKGAVFRQRLRGCSISAIACCKETDACGRTEI